MAKAGDKRRLESNTKTLSLLLKAIAAAVVIHTVFKFALFRSSVTKKGIFGFALTMILEVVCYRALSQLAVPSYGPRGELTDGGADLSLGGVTAYYFDAIYISVFVQIATVLSSWFWLVLLLGPAYAAFQLWVHIISPWVFQPGQQEAPETDAMRAKREKSEKRQQRRANRYS